jgi:hypothetical protein
MIVAATFNIFETALSGPGIQTYNAIALTV